MKLVKYTQKNSYNSKHPPSYPNEMMVRIFNSKKFSNIKINSPKKNKVLEIGCFSGNNLKYFIENGYKPFGVEINQKLIDLGKNNLERLKTKPPIIKVGTNINLPFEKKKFNTLVSINTLHYNSGNQIYKALQEYNRVLKKGGVLYLETVGKNHFAKKLSKKIKNLCYKSKLKDFRKNHIFGYFENKIHLKKILKRYFNKVEIFEKYEMTKINLHSYVAICKK